MAEVFAAAIAEAGTGGAFADDGDGRGGEAGVEELAAVGFPKVEVDLGAEVGVAGGAGGEEKHGIFFANGVGDVDLGEEPWGVGELAVELVAHLLSDGEAACADRWTDGRDEVLGSGAELLAEGADAALDDAGEGAAPASVEGGDGVGAGVGDEHGNAVGGEDAEKEVGIAGEQSVAAQEGFAFCGGQWERAAVDASDDAGVALADGDEVGEAGGFAGFGDGGNEATAGFGYSGGVVFRRVAEVLFRRTSGGVGSGLAALPGAETCPKPRIGFPCGNGDDAGATMSDRSGERGLRRT